MLVLGGTNYHSETFESLGYNAHVFIEISNSFMNTLADSISIKNYFNEISKPFDISELDIEFAGNATLSEIALFAYKYLNAYDINETDDSYEREYLDCYEGNETLLSTTEIDKNSFVQLLEKYFVKPSVNKSIVPDFWQLINFITLFGFEMQKLASCCYLTFHKDEEDK